MVDVHEPAIRSYNMSRIRCKNTKPEIIVRKYLFSKGLRYRICDTNLPGKPDIVLKKHNTVIFIHGCFWHGHNGCKYFKVPETRKQWWLDKITINIKRDSENIISLKKKGWSVLIVWECELKKSKMSETLQNLFKRIKKDQTA